MTDVAGFVALVQVTALHSIFATYKIIHNYPKALIFALRTGIASITVPANVVPMSATSINAATFAANVLRHNCAI